MDGVCNRVIFQFALEHHLLAELAGDHVRVPHRLLATVHVVWKDAAGEFFKTERALRWLLLAKVRYMLLIFG